MCGEKKKSALMKNASTSSQIETYEKTESFSKETGSVSEEQENIKKKQIENLELKKTQ